MRRVVVLALLALALPMGAWASGIDLGNKYGTISVSNSGITSKGSELMSFNGITAPGHDLGLFNFSTGAMISGSWATGGTFSSTGSSFTISSMGKYGQPRGAIFTGSFVGPITLTLQTTLKGGAIWTLTGEIKGIYTVNGVSRMATGMTTQTLYSTNAQLAAGIVHIRGGSTSLAAPEPGTLGLLGTGLVGIAGMFRRKLLKA